MRLLQDNKERAKKGGMVSMACAGPGGVGDVGSGVESETGQGASQGSGQNGVHKGAVETWPSVGTCRLFGCLG